MEWYETHTSSEAPGLEARVGSDDWWENPLAWIGAKEVHVPRKGMHGVEGYTSEVPGLITCPTCKGDGELEVHGFPVGCSRCKGDGDTRAESSAEWCKDFGTVAAVPISYNFDGSQPWVTIEEWGGDDLPDAVIYTEDESSSEDCLEGAIRDLGVAVEQGYYYVTVEVSEDSDLPADVLDGFGGDSCGGFLGWKYTEEEAERMLLEAYAYVGRELEERRAWAERDVVTVGAAA